MGQKVTNDLCVEIKQESPQVVHRLPPRGRQPAKTENTLFMTNPGELTGQEPCPVGSTHKCRSIHFPDISGFSLPPLTLISVHLIGFNMTQRETHKYDGCKLMAKSPRSTQGSHPLQGSQTSASTDSATPGQRSHVGQDTKGGGGQRKGGSPTAANADSACVSRGAQQGSGWGHQAGGHLLF